MKKIGIISICLLILLVAGCKNEKESKGKEVLERVIEENNYIVVDVRTKEEYEIGHVKGALNIPYDEIDEEIGLDKEKIIMVYCKSGRRSHIAYETLSNLGYQVIDLGAYDTVSLEKE